MKRIICFALLLCLLVPAAWAESLDLDSLSFQELAALRDRIQLAMMQRDEWQEVTVPQGVYKVGEDIPAGTWTVKCFGKYVDEFMMGCTEITWGEKLDESGQDIAWGGVNETAFIYSPLSSEYEGGITEYTFTVKDGFYIIISSFHNKAVFIPYTGKPDLGFK